MRITPANTRPSRHWGQRCRAMARSRAGAPRTTLETHWRLMADPNGVIRRPAVPGIDRAVSYFEAQPPGSAQSHPRARDEVQGQLVEVGTTRDIRESDAGTDVGA